MVKEQFTKGHPIHTYLVETDLILDLVEQIEETNPEHEFQKFYNLFNHLSTVERRFERKENQLFPFLEEKGWTGPSRNMWSFHDTIRDIFRIVRKNIGEKNAAAAWENAKYAGQNLKNLLAVENSVLFPNAMEIFTDEDWIKVRKGEDEIGWMLKESPAPYPNEPQYIHPAEDKVRRTDVVFADDASHFDEGYLTVEQVNLMFKTLRIDLTYVDESDRVIFYNRGDERVFPRSAGIIGREVKFCHPPKSVDTVLKILEAFRKGEQSEASFWFHYKEKLIYVRYFAVRDSDKKYRGVIEMSQDISETKKIEGEKRLLEWK